MKTSLENATHHTTQESQQVARCTSLALRETSPLSVSLCHVGFNATQREYLLPLCTLRPRAATFLVLAPAPEIMLYPSCTK